MRTTTTEVSPGGEEAISATPPRRSDESGAVAERFSEELTLAENANLRERIGRLEASIAFWAADLDELNAENERMCAERESLKQKLRDAEHGRQVAEDARATLEVVLEDRDDRIGVLEDELQEADRREIHARSTRARLHSLRMRVRERLAAQSREIEDLRRMVQLGHAARLQVEEELRQRGEDQRRDARYLDKLEHKLRVALERAEGRG